MQLQVDQWKPVTKADMLNMLAIFGDDSPTNHGLVRSWLRLAMTCLKYVFWEA